ncbi:MAG: hypothetical protein J7J31_10955 [Helicobacteraceae bacterium]|nr:hypothetical protein [Helicobacteraceae bacterium]
MKRYIFSFALASLLLYADEIQRIESIVKDITLLRTQYEECQEKLSSGGDTLFPLKQTLKDEQQKNILLLSELDACKNSHQENEKLRFRILELEKSNIDLENILKSKYEKLLAQKDNRIKYLENQIKNKQKPIKEEFNQFPKLVMKKETLQKREIPSKIDKSSVKEQVTEPSVYRLKYESDIFESVDGVVVDRWEEERSFTSNRKYKNWVKITGYFVDQKWRKAERDLWIVEENILKRD